MVNECPALTSALSFSVLPSSSSCSNRREGICFEGGLSWAELCFKNPKCCASASATDICIVNETVLVLEPLVTTSNVVLEASGAITFFSLSSTTAPEFLFRARSVSGVGRISASNEAIHYAIELYDSLPTGGGGGGGLGAGLCSGCGSSGPYASWVCLCCNQPECCSSDPSEKCVITSEVTVGFPETSVVAPEVHLHSGGQITFSDANGCTGGTTEISFKAASVVVEAGGSLVAGSPEAPFGSTGCTLRIGIYGDASSPIVTCSVNQTCGFAPRITGTPVKIGDWPNAPVDYLYPYGSLYEADGTDIPYSFGRKVLAGEGFCVTLSSSSIEFDSFCQQ
jgi:hypothetical protein